MRKDIYDLYLRMEDTLKSMSASHGVGIKLEDRYIDFCRGDKMVRISINHLIYSKDLIRSFDYYFDAVEYSNFDGLMLVDYSLGKYHDVKGFPLMPVFFPSLAEPVATTRQYLDFAALTPGMNVLDLGAYAGLTSILFKECVGPEGRVVAMDADRKNLDAAEKNLRLYKKITNHHIDLVYGAIWQHGDGLVFSSEGNMGSAAVDIVGGHRGDVVRVPSRTLSQLMEMSQLDSVDFIKCDVEGAERVIFEDAAFFKKHRPRIIVETHKVNGTISTEKVIADLEGCGYTCQAIQQAGVDLPLVECRP